MKPLSNSLLAAIVLLFPGCLTAAADEPHPLAGKAITLPKAPAPGQVDLPRFPSISPDGSAICFSWRGDLWRVNADGGQATRLTAHPAIEDQSVWSPDGKHIAFGSQRSGYRNIYRMNADGTDITAITREDRHLAVHGWSSDATLTLSGFLEADIHKSPRPYAVSANGGPITRLHDAFGRSAVVSPNGRHIAFVRGRGDWDRPFLTNSDSRDLWLYDRQDQSFRRLTTNPGHDGKPQWLDNDTLVYLSGRPPARINLYKMDINDGEAAAVALTRLDEDVQSFDLSRSSRKAVLHAWDKLYILDVANAQAKPAALSITASTDTDDRTRILDLAGEANQAALSPDGKVMAVSIHGELYVRTIGSQNPPQRITQHIAHDASPAWSPDGRVLYFTSDRDGTLGIYQAKVALTRSDIEASLEPKKDEEQKMPSKGNDAEKDNASEQTALDDPKHWHEPIRFTIEPVVQTKHHDTDALPSPDGKTLSFRRGNGTLMLLDLASGEERTFLESWDADTHWAWSGDSQHLAIAYADQDHNTDIWVGPADGSKPLINITKHPATDANPSFSHDGKVLAFTSGRNDGQHDIYAVYLDKTLETYTPQQLTDYYKDAAKKADKLEPLSSSKPLKEEEEEEEKEDTADEDDQTAEPTQPMQAASLDLDDAYLRLRSVTNSSDSEWQARILPGGDKIVFSRSGDLYTIGWDGEDEEKLGDDIALQHLSLTGSHVAALRNGTAAKIAIDGGKRTAVAITGSITVDRAAQQQQRFIECARAITMHFYDGTFKGIDWPSATDKYAQLAARTWTTDEFDDVANRYLGLLEASHMGIRSPAQSASTRQPNGRLGARYERIDAGYKVIAIEDQTPAAEGVMRLQVGDIITAIGFKPIQPTDTIATRLRGRVGQETAVTVLRQEEGQDQPVERHLLMTPISYSQLDDIRYKNWQLKNKADVAALSDGRLGYIHIEAMNTSSLAEFERDLYAACEGRDGLIIDVRDNGGGWITDRLLASIMTRRHAYTVPRGADPKRTNSYPNSRLFIPRYNLPINALCNEHSFSNAEIFSHAFKTLERGTLVGNTTAGGVISTGRASLLDGTTIRLPFRGWYLPDGTDMENNGAVPDILIPQSPQDEAAGKDRQLEAAIQDLIKRLDN